MTDTNYEEKYNELIDFLRGEYTKRLTNELGDHVALRFLLGLLSPWIQAPVQAPAENVVDRIKQIMNMDMAEDEKNKLIASLMGRQDEGDNTQQDTEA